MLSVYLRVAHDLLPTGGMSTSGIADLEARVRHEIEMTAHPRTEWMAPLLRDGKPVLDVLIVGCGPAGLTLAAQLAAFPDIKTRIVEQKDGPLRLGQADGVACRTVETFEAFGLGGKLVQEGYWVNETVFWRPSPDDRSKIVRTGRVQKYTPRKGANQAFLVGKPWPGVW